MRKLLLGLIGLLLALPSWSADLPSGYTELQYIESTGTQYIDTGLYGTLNTEAEIDVHLNETSDATGNRIFGNYTNTEKAVTINASHTNGSAQRFGDKSTSTEVYSSERSVYKTNKTNLTRNGVVLVTFNTTTPFTTEGTLLLGTTGTSTVGVIGKIYSAIVRENGTVVRNFVPAKNSSNVIGMYDTVNNEFYANQGTGDFVAGPVIPEQQIRIATTAYNSARFSPVVTELNDTIATIRSVVTNTINQTKAIADLQATKQTRPDETCPAGKKCLLVEDNAGQPHWYEIIEKYSRLPDGYTELEYLQSDGEHGINTNIIPGGKKIGMEAKFQFTSLSPATATIIGSGVTDNTDNCRLWGLYNGRYRIKLGNTGMSYGTPDTNIHTVIVNMSDGGAWLDGQKIWTNPQQTIPTSNNTNLNIFTDNGGGGTFSAAKIYYLKLYDNDVLIADYIPARNSANKIGFYDTVSGRFFTNAGTGTFVAGPEI